MIKTNSSKSGPLLWFIAIPEKLSGLQERALSPGLGPEDTHPSRLPETLHPRIRAERLLGRYYLRQLLEETTGYLGSTWRIAPDGDGKPQATHPQDRTAIHVNLSHTRGALLCGLSDVSPLGVDLENIQRKVRFGKLQERCFTRAENGWIAEASNLEDGFFRAWTLKEAYLKATGLGIRIELKDLEIVPSASGPIGIAFRGKSQPDCSIGTRLHDHFRLSFCEVKSPDCKREALWEFQRFAK